MARAQTSNSGRRLSEEAQSDTDLGEFSHRCHSGDSIASGGVIAARESVAAVVVDVPLVACVQAISDSLRVGDRAEDASNGAHPSVPALGVTRDEGPDGLLRVGSEG